MKEYNVNLTLRMPDSVTEKEMEETISNAVYDMGGELIDSGEYELISEYPSRGDFDE